MREGAAEHFLTDAFSAGHIRTPRKSISDYWGARYPNFFKAFVKFMEDKVVEGLEGTANYFPGAFVPEGVRRGGIHIGPLQKDGAHQKIQAKLASVPPITFGDLLGKIVHDVDNKNGLWVTNDLGHVGAPTATAR